MGKEEEEERRRGREGRVRAGRKILEEGKVRKGRGKARGE